MKKQPILNRLCVWAKIPTDGLYSKKYTSNRTYSVGRELGVASTDKPVYAYAKNYKKSKLDFSLFMYSDSSDEKVIEEFFDKSISKVTAQVVADALVIASSNNFEYTELEFKESVA